MRIIQVDSAEIKALVQRFSTGMPHWCDPRIFKTCITISSGARTSFPLDYQIKKTHTHTQQ